MPNRMYGEAEPRVIVMNINKTNSMLDEPYNAPGRITGNCEFLQGGHVFGLHCFCINALHISNRIMIIRKQLYFTVVGSLSVRQP